MLKHYLTTAFRNFRRHWVTTIVNTVGLALGLAAFIGAASVVKYYDLDDSHYAGSERTYFVMTTYEAMGTRSRPVNAPRAPMPMAAILKAQIPNDGVAQVTSGTKQSITYDQGVSEIETSFGDQSFLELFPMAFAYGDSGKALKEPRTAVIAESAAIRLFGRRDVVGKRIMLEGKEAITLTGVFKAPAQPSHIGQSQSSLLRFDLLISLDTLRALLAHTRKSAEIETMYGDWDARAGSPTPITYIRLKSSNRFDLDQLNGRLSEQSRLHPNTANRTFVALPLPQLRATWLRAMVPSFGMSWQWSLLVICGIVLLASCLNYANLSAAVLLSKRKEIGVRRVIGASSRQLMTQSVAESSLLTVVALMLALTLLVLLRPVTISLFDIDLTYSWRHSIDVWMTVVVAMLLVTLAVAAYPALLARRSQISTALKQERSDTSRHSGARWLVATQFLLASVLLIGIFIVRSQNEALRQHALQTLPEPIVTIENNLTLAGTNFETLRNELSVQPGIASVSGSSYSPWGQTFGLVPLSRSLDPQDREFPAMTLNIGERYFSTMGIPLLAGQQFDEIGDAFRTAKDIRVVIDRSLARKLGHQDPRTAIDTTIFPGPSLKQLRDIGVSLHVIGVVEDKAWQFSTNGASGTVFQRPVGQALTPIVRLSKSQLVEGLANLDSTWKRLSPSKQLRRDFMDERIEKYIAERNFTVRMLGWVTALAALIATSGLIGMSVHMANRRRHEIGVRKTLGARTAQVMSLLIRDFSKPVILGNLIAWPLAYYSTQAYIDQYVYRMGFSVLPFILGFALTAAVALVAVLWQTVRAARLNPAAVLRHE